MNIILTGATGIIGREVLTELLLRNWSDCNIQHVFCLARGSRNNTAENRMMHIFRQIAAELEMDIKKIMQVVKVVDTTEDQPRSFSSLLKCLKTYGVKEVSVLHLASTTNLSPLATVEDEIYRDSYLPTIDLLNALLPYVKQYSFVSTAFSCGHQVGLIANEFSQLDISHNRNYYERYKRQAEIHVKEICEQRGIRWQILRAGIVSGRLIRKPYYYTPKFNVFYAWAGFFASLKANGLSCDGIRIQANKQSGVNIIPSDYVAKATVRAFFAPEITELNLIHSRNFENTRLIPALLASVGVNDFSLVDDIPANVTVAEKMYYKTVGLQFSPYLFTSAHQYDASKIRQLMWDIPEPNIPENFQNIMNYAVEKQFRSEAI